MGGQWSCDYSISGNQSYIHNLIWYNHKVSVRLYVFNSTGPKFFENHLIYDIFIDELNP